MKISLLTKSLIPESGGAERYALQLTLGLAQLGHEIHIFCPKFSGITLENVIHHPIPAITPDIAKYAKKEIPNSIIYSLVPCFPIDAYRAGDGVHIHWQHLKYPNPILRCISAFISGRFSQFHLEKMIYSYSQNCKVIIANSFLVKQHIEQYYPLSKNRIHVVHNGVDTNIFHPLEKKSRQEWLAKQGINFNGQIWLFAANNWERKGLRTLLLAAKPFLVQKESIVIVAGRGKIAKWQAWLKKENITQGVFFIGSSNLMPFWYAYSDIFILPTWYDPFSNVCLEAMASGTPVITTLENGASEIIQANSSHSNHNGYILENSQDSCILRKFLEQMQNHALRDKMGQNALITAKELTMDRNVQKTFQILQEIH